MKYNKYLKESKKSETEIYYDVEMFSKNNWSILNKNLTLQQAKKLKETYSESNKSKDWKGQIRIVKVVITRTEIER